MSTDQGLSLTTTNTEQRQAALLCLTVVAGTHGVHLTPEQIIHDNQIQGDEIPPATLLRCAKHAGLTGKVLGLNWRHLAKLGNTLPAIVFLTNGAPLVLQEVRITPELEYVILRDPMAPEDAPLVLDRVRFTELWAGSTLILKRDYSLRDEDQPFGLKFIGALILRERRILRDVVISACFLSVLALVPILAFRILTDRVLAHSAMSTFIVICIGLAIATLFETTFSALRRALQLHLTARIDVKMSMQVFERIINLPVETFERVPVGMIARYMSEIQKIKNFLSNQLFGTVLDSLCLVIFVPIMFYFSPLLTGIVLACCVVIGIWTILMLPVYGRRSRITEEAEGARGSFLIQTLHGIRTVKSLALEPRQIHQYDVHVAKIAHARIAEGHVANVIQSFILPIDRFMLTGTLTIGVYLAMSSENPTAVGEIFIFLLLSQRVVGPLQQLTRLIEQYQEAKSSLDMVTSFINAEPEDARRGQGVRQSLVGSIEFNAVQFRYSGASNPALKRVTFEVPAGTTIGIMGRSGSGKTTVTRLLQRLHSNFEGLIKIDGIDIREYALDHLRSSLGVVLQDNYLFSGTIRENISAAKPSATFEEVVRAARLAGAEEFIDRLPRGYETYIAEGSNNLSGGQRQRIAIARALITDPRVLILDEATSALDPDSEAIVNANLRRISEGRTMIVISHRLSSLVDSDAIMVLERGEVHDIGKHAELMLRCDIYRDLWNQQNAGPRERPESSLRLVG